MLMKVKGTFNQVSRNCLLHIMKGMDADGDLMQLTEKFMSDRSVSLIID